MQETITNPQRALLTALICAAMLLCFGITAITAVDKKSATVDEPLHLGAAMLQTHYADFRWDSDNPPLWKYYFALGTDAKKFNIPLDSAGRPLLQDSTFGKFCFDDLYTTPGLNPDAVFVAAHQRMILLGIALGAIIAWWSWRWGGMIAAIVATAAYSFDPNFLAHGALVKNDVPIALAFVAIMLAVWMLGESASFLRWLAVSLLLGAALTIKFSGVLAVPILGLALLGRACLPAAWPILKWNARTFLQRLSAAITLGIGSLLVAYVCIWACYGFRYQMSPDPAHPFDYSTTLKMYATDMAAYEHNATSETSGPQLLQWSDQWQPDLFYRVSLSALEHHLLPEAWIVGLLTTNGTTHWRSAFLCGQLSRTGWWYYFPLAMLFKTPLATLTGILFAVAILFRGPLKRKISMQNSWPLLAAAIGPVLYGVASLLSHLDLGLRHVLPIYCFLFIFLGVIAARLWARRPRATAIFCAIFVAGLLVETYAAYPDFISFFNAAAGGSRGGLRLLSDSNLDWGQDLRTVGDWQKQHPDRTVCLYYFGSADPHYYGIKYCLARYGHDTPFPSRQEMTKMNVVIAISATELQQTYTAGDPEIKFWADLRNAQPTQVLGGSIYLYDLH